MDFHNRQYDPQLGRFLGVDALADAGGQQVLSPYHAMGCNPAMMVDPFGLRSAVFDNGARPMETGPTVAPIIPINTNARYILLDQIMYADQAAFHQEIRERMQAEAEGEEASNESATNGNSSDNNAPTNNSSSAAGNTLEGKNGDVNNESDEAQKGDKNEPVYETAVYDGTCVYYRLDNPEAKAWDLNGDGKLSKKEADAWYSKGNGIPIIVDNSKINWSGLQIPKGKNSGDWFAINTTTAFWICLMKLHLLTAVHLLKLLMLTKV